MRFPNLHRRTPVRMPRQRVTYSERGILDDSESNSCDRRIEHLPRYDTGLAIDLVGGLEALGISGVVGHDFGGGVADAWDRSQADHVEIDIPSAFSFCSSTQFPRGLSS